MTFYKILVPLVLLKNNEIAEYGEVVDGERFASPVSDLVKGDYITRAKKEELSEDQLAAYEQAHKEEQEAKDKAAEQKRLADEQAEQERKEKEFQEAQKQAVADAAKSLNDEAGKAKAAPAANMIDVPVQDVITDDKAKGPDPTKVFAKPGK